MEVVESEAVYVRDLQQVVQVRDYPKSDNISSLYLVGCFLLLSLNFIHVANQSRVRLSDQSIVEGCWGTVLFAHTFST